MHVGALRGTEIQIQLTRKVTPKRPNRLKPIRRAYTVWHGILSEATAEARAIALGFLRHRSLVVKLISAA